jgi:hypothetical protein
VPGGGDVPHRRHAERQQHGTTRDHWTRAATIDGHAHCREDQRGGQVEDGDACRDERDRPAAGLGDLVEIDTRAEYAEAPREYGGEEAECDDAPAVGQITPSRFISATAWAVRPSQSLRTWFVCSPSIGDDVTRVAFPSTRTGQLGILNGRCTG